MPRNNVFAVAAGVMCVMVGLPALAQIDGDEEPTVDREALPDILITAQRRQTGLQDTPVTVTALSERQLQQRVVVQTLGLGRQVPNLVASNNITLGGSNAYYLRGIGSQESLASFDPPVITYVDEVVDPRQIANNVMLLDIERLEVLRGPQGTLFGRNTTGGAISIITRKPGPEFEAKGELS
ncbi:MAG: TonB-dependent receptor plug domain-containing protein, partial [Sphingomonadales bacterium]|nr:TonB-dependent receptor plug domain-containing protein [Sphingomonadales bacterium]